MQQTGCPRDSAGRLRRGGGVSLVKDGVHQMRLFRAPIWCNISGGINGVLMVTRERQGGTVVAGSLAGRSSTRTRTVARLLGRVRTRFGRDGGQLNHRRAMGVLNAFARESEARAGRFLRGKLISDQGMFSSYEGQQGAANRQDFWAVFQGCTGL